MKLKLIAALLCTSAWLGLKSQNIINNTTAQTVAYWEVGNIYKAAVTETNEGVKKGVPFKTTSKGSVQIEVIDATDTTYTLEWSFGKWTTTPPVTDKIQLAIEKAFEPIKVRYQTTETGVYKEIINWHEIMAASDSAINGILATITDKPLRDTMRTMLPLMLTQQLYENVFSKYIVSFHAAYGLEYKLNESYGGDVPTPNPWDNDMPIMAQYGITMTSLNKTTAMAHFSVVQEVYEDEAQKFIAAFMGTLSASSGQVPDLELQLTMKVEQDINLKTTWPTQTTFSEVKQVEKNKAQKQTIKIVAVR